jgi:hypothetical protein
MTTWMKQRIHILTNLINKGARCEHLVQYKNYLHLSNDVSTLVKYGTYKNNLKTILRDICSGQDQDLLS